MIDLAKVVIWAEDKTKEGVESAQRNLQGVNNEVDALRGKWAALGSLLGITAFAAMVKGAIDAQAKIKDLAEQSGMTVEQLTRFEGAARRGGDGLDGIAAAVAKLSKSMLEAKDPTSAAAQALRAINLSYEELKDLSPDEVLIRIAKAQAEFDNGLEKNARLMVLLGKSGAQFQTTLNEIAEAQDLAATSSQKQANAADLFNDTLSNLGLRFAKFGRQIADELLEYLNPLVQAFDEMPETALSTLGVIDLLGYAFRYLGGIVGTAWLTLVDFGDALGAIAAKAVAFFKGDWAGIQAINKARDEKAEQNNDAIGRMWARLQGTLKEEIALKKERKKLEDPEEEDEQRKSTIEAYEEANRKLDQQIGLWREKERLGRSLTESEKELAEIEAGKYAKLAPAEQAALKRKAELWKIEQDLAGAAKAELDARLKEIEALNAKIEAAKLENDTLGMTGSEIAELTALRLEERRAQLLGVEGAELQVKALDIQIGKYRELAGELRRGEGLKAYQEDLRRATENQVRMWDEVSSRAADFFTDLVLNGKDAFQRLKEQLKGLLADMIAIFAKRWVLNLAANATGSANLAASAAGVGQGSLAGSLLSSGLNWLGTGTGAVSSAFAGGAEFFGGMTGTFMGPAAPGSMAAMGSQVGAFLTNPVTLAVLAAVVIAVALRSRQGGPKEGGSFFGAYDSQGRFTGNLTVPGSDNGRFYTPDGGDPIARQVGDSVAEGFFQILGKLGGSTQGVQFGFGYDKDPRGSAQSRVTSLVQGADGRTLYSSTMDAGRDDEEFNRVMALQTKRAILAGLQGSELPEAIAAVLNSVSVATASSEEIDNILLVGEAMKNLLDTLSPLNVEEILGNASRTAIDAWRAQGEQLTDLANNTTLTVESLGQLAQATGQYRAQAAALILQFEQARKVVSGGIGETLRDFKFQTLDKQGQYDFLRSEASMLAGGIGNMQDAQQIVDTVNQIRQASSQAFGMLSDEEKRAKLAEYETGLKEVQRVADERLVALRTQVKTEADAQLARQEKIVTDMATAAADIKSGASDIKSAATTLSNGVTLRVDAPEGYEVGVNA